MPRVRTTREPGAGVTTLAAEVLIDELDRVPVIVLDKTLAAELALEARDDDDVLVAFCIPDEPIG